MIKTAAEYRALAADCGRRNQESWERSDSDGFLSQWAMQQMQSRYLDNASIVEAGGIETYVVVEIATGEVVATMADQREGQYGYYFLINDDAVAARLGRFLTDSSAKSEATRERNNAKKGIRIEARFIPLSDLYESSKTGRIDFSDLSSLKVGA